jgi:hypothetical protein
MERRHHKRFGTTMDLSEDKDPLTDMKVLGQNNKRRRPVIVGLPGTRSLS